MRNRDVFPRTQGDIDAEAAAEANWAKSEINKNNNAVIIPIERGPVRIHAARAILEQVSQETDAAMQQLDAPEQELELHG